MVYLPGLGLNKLKEVVYMIRELGIVSVYATAGKRLKTFRMASYREAVSSTLNISQAKLYLT
jgi:hypothetical protein